MTGSVLELGEACVDVGGPGEGGKGGPRMVRMEQAQAQAHLSMGAYNSLCFSGTPRGLTAQQLSPLPDSHFQAHDTQHSGGPGAFWAPHNRPLQIELRSTVGRQGVPSAFWQAPETREDLGMGHESGWVAKDGDSGAQRPPVGRPPGLYARADDILLPLGAEVSVQMPGVGPAVAGQGLGELSADTGW